MSDLIEALADIWRARIAEAKADIANDPGPWSGLVSWHGEVSEAEAIISALSAVPVMKEALRPFAEQADEIEAIGARHGIEAGAIIRKVSYDDCVSARAALGEDGK